MNFCPHCHSGNDPVLKDTTWSCGVRFNDALWRTKECYERQNARLNQRIKHLEDIINRAHLAFFSDSSDRKVSIAMHRILDEEVRKEAP